MNKTGLSEKILRSMSIFCALIVIIFSFLKITDLLNIFRISFVGSLLPKLF